MSVFSFFGAVLYHVFVPLFVVVCGFPNALPTTGTTGPTMIIVIVPISVPDPRSKGAREKLYDNFVLFYFIFHCNWFVR